MEEDERGGGDGGGRGLEGGGRGGGECSGVWWWAGETSEGESEDPELSRGFRRWELGGHPGGASKEGKNERRGMSSERTRSKYVTTTQFPPHFILGISRENLLISPLPASPDPNSDRATPHTFLGILNIFWA